MGKNKEKCTIYITQHLIRIVRYENISLGFTYDEST